MLFRIPYWVLSIKIHGALNELLNEESQEKDVKSKDSGIHTKHTQILSNLFELQLKGGHLITVLLKLSLDLAIA
jgi:hypothetical protein